MTRAATSIAAILLTTSAFAQMLPPPPPGGMLPVWQHSMTIGGTVARFTLTPRGDIDGLSLTTIPRFMFRPISPTSSQRR
jgi:hypothetical protein